VLRRSGTWDSYVSLRSKSSLSGFKEKRTDMLPLRMLLERAEENLKLNRKSLRLPRKLSKKRKMH